MLFMSFSKKTISAAEFQRQLNHPEYDTVWQLMHKIRTATGNRDRLYDLKGEVEFDEGYFERSMSKRVKLKRAKCSQLQVNVAVLAESTPLEDIETGKKSSSCRYFKMKVLSTHKKESADELLRDKLEEKSIVFSDKSANYVNISDYVETHISEKSTSKTNQTTLKWVQIAISCSIPNFRTLY